MRHPRYAAVAVAVVAFIAIPLTLAITSAQSSPDGPVGQPPARPSLVQNLKEVNYYPAAGGWTYMWSHFDQAAINRDFARIRGLDANTVRIIIQPTVFGFPSVRPLMARRLSEVIGLAARHSLRVHLTLFDWWHRYTDIRGSKEWVSSLLSRYWGDPNIAVLELQNEVSPKNRQAVAWVATMLPYLSTVMPGTLRTVSTATVPPAEFAKFTRELRRSPPDFWDYHYYGPARDAFPVLSQIRALAAPRRLFIGETGRSTDGTPGWPGGGGAGSGCLLPGRLRRGRSVAAARSGAVDPQRLLSASHPAKPGIGSTSPVRLWPVPPRRHRQACRRCGEKSVLPA